MRYTYAQVRAAVDLCFYFKSPLLSRSFLGGGRSAGTHRSNSGEGPKKEPISTVDVPEMTTTVVVVQVNMYCQACSQKIKKKILKMHGVQEVDPNLKTSEVTVKGMFEPERLVEYVNKKTKKQVVVLLVNQNSLLPLPKEAEKSVGGEKEIMPEEKEDKSGNGGEGEVVKNKEEIDRNKANTGDRTTITKKWSSRSIQTLGLKKLLPWRWRVGEGDQEERAELLLPTADLY